jgi:hypothetical protein
MTDLIQRNAASILAISLRLFSNAAVATVNPPPSRISDSAQDAVSLHTKNNNLEWRLLTV